MILKITNLLIKLRDYKSRRAESPLFSKKPPILPEPEVFIFFTSDF
ncbi:hypothetical protein FHS59_000152 [Algoriphagus iocasae]|uniref:Uncharacterized protein n=1 Tax=Algoriphagus iocasae TaxID=1836499 RepID=A0A841MGB4_9BACT|nr:hypothetical protein [Algoriphagus iocasae]